jgi:hypothetical protein
MSSPYLAHCDRLGELVKDYDATVDERVLNEIFRVTRDATDAAMLQFHKPYYLIEDLRQDVIDYTAEMVTLKIWQNTKRFLKPDFELKNYIGRCVYNNVIYLGKSKLNQGHTKYVNDPENELRDQLTEMLPKNSIEDRLNLEDQVTTVVKAIGHVIRQTHRFSDRWQFFLWPVLHALINSSDETFRKLNYRDRVALRGVLIRCAVYFQRLRRS